MLSLLNKTKVALWHDNFTGAVLIAIHDAVEDMPPVNAVELPCKVGDTIFSTNGGVISESVVKRITIFKDNCLLTIKDLRLGEDFMIEEWDIDPNNEDDSKYAFFTREEAEKALEDLENG